MIVHKLRLNDPWFDYVKIGRKLYEGRRATEKTALIEPGDTIEFSRVNKNVNKSTDTIRASVVKVLSFPTFREALKSLPIDQVLPDVATIDAGVEIYSKFVSETTQLKDGIKMIYIKPE